MVRRRVIVPARRMYTPRLGDLMRVVPGWMLCVMMSCPRMV